MSSTSSIGTGIVCSSIVLLILPYDLYWLRKFYRHKNVFVIKKRKPGLLAIQHTLYWLWISITVVASMIYNIAYQHNNAEVGTAMLVISGSAVLLVQASLAIGITRYWLIFYMMHHNAAIINNKWQSVIDPRSTARNWFIENKTKYGSWTYLKWWAALYVVICVISLFLRVVRSPYEVVAIAAFLLYCILVFVFPAGLYIHMLCATPKHRDDIGMRAELRYTAFASIANLLLLFALISTIAWFSIDYGGFIYTYLYYLSVRILYLFVTLKTTKWPLTKFSEIILGRHSTAKMIELAHQDTYRDIAQSLNKASLRSDLETQMRETMALRKEMREQLQNSAMLEAFMNLLLAEYCSECLLSVIEFIQFKRKIIDDNRGQIGRGLDLDTDDLQTMFTLPASCPQSFIVHGDEDPNYIRNYNYIARKLYRKFVKVGAQYEINIDYATRNSLKNLFENERNLNAAQQDLAALYRVFNGCIDQMIALITPSFSRFQKTQTYSLLQHTYSPPNKPIAMALYPINQIQRLSASRSASTISKGTDPLIDIELAAK